MLDLSAYHNLLPMNHGRVSDKNIAPYTDKEQPMDRELVSGNEMVVDVPL